MIYFLYGTDTFKARKKLHELLDTLVGKRPNAEVFKITSENWSEPQFDELLASQGLFDEKYIVVLDNVFEKKDVKSFVLERLARAGESEQVFLILEGKVDAATLKKVEGVSKKVQEFALPESKREKYNIFSITDGLLSKDKKKLWISYIEMLGKGAVSEEIHGILFWQTKNMLIASKAKSQKDAGLSLYAYKNALSGCRNYKTEELVQISEELVDMTHKVRSGEGDLDIMLEKWMLGV